MKLRAIQISSLNEKRREKIESRSGLVKHSGVRHLVSFVLHFRTRTCSLHRSTFGAILPTSFITGYIESRGAIDRINFRPNRTRVNTRQL